MFVGTYTPKLDEKNRLFLPAKFRDAARGGTRGDEGSGALPQRLPARRLRGMTDRIQEAPLTVTAGA